MNNFIKEDDKQTILIVNEEGTKRYRVRPNQVKEVEEMLSQRKNQDPAGRHSCPRADHVDKLENDDVGNVANLGNLAPASFVPLSVREVSS